MPPVEPPVEKPTSTDTAPSQAVAKPSLKERLKILFVEYGVLAAAVYLSTLVVSMAVFSVAILSLDLKSLGARFGVPLEGTRGLLGTLGAAYVLSKLISVPRMLATLALTPLIARIPFVGRLLQRFKQWQEEAAKQ